MLKTSESDESSTARPTILTGSVLADSWDDSAGPRAADASEAEAHVGLAFQVVEDFADTCHANSCWESSARSPAASRSALDRAGTRI